MMLRRYLKTASAFFFLLLFCAGCSTGHDYWRNRFDDAKDIASFTTGVGWGAKVQAGALHVDTGYNYSPAYGLRGGEVLSYGLKNHSAEYHVEEGNVGVFLPFANCEIFYPGGHAASRGKAYCAMTPLLPVFVLCPDKHTKDFCSSCCWQKKYACSRAEREKYSRLSPDERKKYKGKRVPLTEQERRILADAIEKENPTDLPFDGWRAWHKYSDIEVTAAVIGGFSFGFNPGELLDFLAGFVFLDIYRDDL